jgi:drug/metabolite transporter (DMT)-like permease
VLISRAMVALPVALAGLLLLAQPIVAYLLDVALFDLPTTPRQWLGLAVSLAGIFVAGMKSKEPVAAQEA